MNTPPLTGVRYRHLGPSWAIVKLLDPGSKSSAKQTQKLYEARSLHLLERVNRPIYCANIAPQPWHDAQLPVLFDPQFVHW